MTALLALTLVGCAVPTESGADAEREAGFMQVEACFSNELANEPVTLKTVGDGSDVRWEATVRPGSTACTRTKGSWGSGLLIGEMSYAGDSTPFSFRFKNPDIGYPQASILIGSRDEGKQTGPGMCESFAALDAGVLDSGTTRFTVRRLTDSDAKRFTVRIQPTQNTQIPNKGCYFGESGRIYW